MTLRKDGDMRGRKAAAIKVFLAAMVRLREPAPSGVMPCESKEKSRPAVGGSAAPGRRHYYRERVAFTGFPNPEQGVAMEQELNRYLKAQTALEPFLATYAGDLAIFFQEIPDDQDPLWGETGRYGRIVYSLDWETHSQRGVKGTLKMELQCQKGEQSPQEAGEILRSLLDGVCFTQDGKTLATYWMSSQPLPFSPETMGATLLFSVAAFPQSGEQPPNPVERFNAWTKESFPQITVVGKDPLPPVWMPTDKSPGIYWKLQKVEPCGWIPNTFQTDWQTATLQGYVLATTPAAMVHVARQLTTALTAQNRLEKKGEPRMLVDRNHRVLVDADPFGQGVMTCEATYGVIRKIPPSEPMDHIFLHGKESGK